MNWIQTHKDIRVAENTSTEILFSYNSSDKVVDKDVRGNYRIITSCGCSSATYNPDKKTLLIFFNSGEIPTHLTLAGHREYATTKYIIVKYTDGTEDKLSFSASIFKK